mmetsp:Transcript_10667/g.31805  ORF Transcript_10667/g.31805 Transcript_10667/m.31805 type:complete len:180 (-) Transcript_10667:39-578(-)
MALSGHREHKDESVLSIILRGPAGEKTCFRVNTFTKFGKVFDTLAARARVPADTLSWSFDGLELSGDQTPADVGLDHFGTIDYHDIIIMVVVRDAFGRKSAVEMNWSMPLSVISNAYARFYSVSTETFLWSFSGVIVRGAQTFFDIGMQDGDVLDVHPAPSEGRSSWSRPLGGRLPPEP